MSDGNPALIQKPLRRANRAASRVVKGMRFPRDCKHERVEWYDAKQRPFVVDVDSQPMEMIAASGFEALASWNAFCVKCGRPILFASYKPKPRELKENGYFRDY